MTGMDTLTQDWGTKWNRIKSAALGNTGSGNSSTVGYGEVNFTDSTGKQWSYPLAMHGYRPIADGTISDLNLRIWSWDNSHSTNQTVGRKSAAQLCEALGNNWRLPTKDELVAAAPAARANGGVQLDMYRWSSIDYPSNPTNAYFVRWSDGYTYYINKTNQYLVSCVR